MRRVIYHGAKIDLALQSVVLANGETAEREVVVHRGAVALVPLLADGRVCLIRNRRYTVGQVLIELPAGTIDPGESPERTAARELEEETGYRAGRIERIADWYVSPGVMTERMYLFLCRDLSAGQLDHQLDETLEPLLVSWSEAQSMARSGQIEDAKTLLGLFLADEYLKNHIELPTEHKLF